MCIVPESEYGKIWLFFGCRRRELDLYRNEKDTMIERSVIDRELLALSREPGIKKVWIYSIQLHL